MFKPKSNQLNSDTKEKKDSFKKTFLTFFIVIVLINSSTKVTYEKYFDTNQKEHIEFSLEHKKENNESLKETLKVIFEQLSS